MKFVFDFVKYGMGIILDNVSWFRTCLTGVVDNARAFKSNAERGSQIDGVNFMKYEIEDKMPSFVFTPP